MKNTLFSLLTLALLFTSCTKDKEKDKEDNKDYILLQKWTGKHDSKNFQYNSEDQLIRFGYTNVESGDKEYSYTTITYNNGLPVKAETYLRTGDNTFFRDQEVTFKMDGQKRIVQTEVKIFTVDGQLARTNKINFGFSGNRLETITDESDAESAYKFKYDVNGNIVSQSYSSVSGGVSLTEKFDATYDNNMSPFAGNGLGMLIFAAVPNAPFETEHLLSANNPLQIKWVSTRTQKKEAGPDAVNIYTDLYEYTNTIDAAGVISGFDYKYSYENKFNGEVVNTQTNTDKVAITAVKKQYK
ncbi:hypothetical protein HHL16_17730 [Pseudoflavitalea sp. G-6-1-2]|uniref:hypothetical protein n=1 Tax=Pseudoflavitalea sp. G-6-1-2 TaxID=2728841 RepID=UPI00146E4F22|nr:hypothetical protein [Pseudoflavitalea sp. G-6-1-2]NML22729.1 hypothetical protein [Pseudoflavitalea sp. G-6-1-2]